MVWRKKSGQVCSQLALPILHLSDRISLVSTIIIRMTQQHGTLNHSPIRMHPIVISQIIQINNQPNLIFIQHLPHSFSVIIIPLSGIIEKLEELSNSIFEEIVGEDWDWVRLGGVVGP